MTVHVSAGTKSASGFSVKVRGPPEATAVCEPLDVQEIVYQEPATSTSSLNVTEMFEPTGTPIELQDKTVEPEMIALSPDGRLVAAKLTGRIELFDAASGRSLWTTRFGSPTFGCATAGDGVVFVPTFDGTLYALDSRSGARLWTARMRAGGCEAVMAHRIMVSRRLVRAVHEAGGQVYVWTVDNADRIRAYEALGVDGVITNDPRLFD